MINDNLLELQIKRYYASINQGFMVLPVSSYLGQRKRHETQAYTTD